MVPNSCLDDPRYRPLYTFTEVSRYARMITGTRVATTMVFDRYSGGESLTDIAADYDLELLAVEEALRCEIERRAA